jgi:hypothetical protein
MPKAVLVMDMPESCKKCVFCRGLNACKLNKYLVGDRICTIYTVDKQIMEGGKPDWCPLRELPEKIPDLEHGYENVEKSIIRTGWNACLDAIAKE